MSHSTLITDYLGTGTLATRPVSPNLPAGCIGVWLASDTGEASLWNGTAWQDIASVNTVASGNGIAQTGSIFGTGTIFVKLGAGLGFSGGNIVSTWQGGTVTSLGSGVSIVAGALTVTGASLTPGANIGISGGTVSVQNSPTFTATGSTAPVVISFGGFALPALTATVFGVTSDTGSIRDVFAAYAGNTQFTFALAGGTQSSPTVYSAATTANLANFNLVGYDGTAWSGSQANITLQGLNNWSTVDHSTVMKFSVTPSGSTTQAEVARMVGSALLVGTTAAVGAEKLNVNGAVITGTITTPGIILNAGSLVTSFGSGLVNTSGVLSNNWQIGTVVTALGTNLSVSGGTLSASGGGSSGLIPNIQTASYTIAATDVGKLVIENATTATTLTVPALATIGTNNVLELSNINTGVVTVTVGATNGTIDTGGTTFFLGQSQAVRMTNNGTNWFTERMVGATTVGAGGGVAFGTGNTVNSTGQGFIAGIGNSINNGAIALGQTLTATGSLSVAIGSSSSVLAGGAIMIGNANTLTGVNNLMIANSSSNSASNPFPAFGLNLLITGGGGGVVAGNSITATGTLSFPYGYQANDHGNALGHYRGQAGPAGSVTTPTQREEYTFWNSNHGTIAVNLSNNGAAPASITVGNPGTKTAGAVDARIVIMDRATGNGVMYYTAVPGIFSKGTTAASMTVNTTLVAGAIYGAGLVLAAAPTLAADTTNGGFSIGYTPPIANTDTLWAIAWLDTKVTPGIA